MTNGIDPGPAVVGEPDEIEAPRLPTAWVNALDLFQRSEVVKEAFGAPFQGCILEPETCRAQQFRAHCNPDRLPLVFESGLRPAMTVFVMFDGDCR